MSKTKVMTILGTRPEIIRLSRVMARLDQFADHHLVHTGQNYDYNLNEIFFADLELRKPDHFLNVETGSLGLMLGNILIRSEEVLRAVRPDAVLILGDTNSAIAAVMARRMKIPVYHMEAGNRCYDENVPEEVNRRLVDHISDFNLVYTEHARRQLLSEGLHHRRIYLTGSPMKEVLDHYRGKIDRSEILAKMDLRPGTYFLASIHREENVDSKRNLSSLLDTLKSLSERWHFPIVLSTHPRTRKRLAALEVDMQDFGIVMSEPFGFIDYNHLQQNAFCVLSDSGTISEESAILGFPAVTVRNAIERPEALDAGSIVITGLHRETIVRGVEAVTTQFARGERPALPADYQIANVSQRVVNLIIGTCKLSHRWSGIELHDYN
jgi:UDP-N-acetyl-L-fucosamine synthase